MLLPGRRDGDSAVEFPRFIVRRGLLGLLMLIGIGGSVLWLPGSHNPCTPAGFVGDLTTVANGSAGTFPAASAPVRTPGASR